MASEHRVLVDRIRGAATDVRRAAEAVKAGRGATGPRPGEWSARETLVHLRNVVMMAYGLRIRRLVYEENPTFADYDEASHRAATMAHGTTVAQLVGMIVAEHEQLAGLLAELPDDRWSRKGRHPELGEMSIEFLARRVAEHAEEHARQIRETAAAVS
jgi:hypothetical protein